MANAKIVLGGEIDIASGNEMQSGFDALRSDLKSATVKARRILRPLTRAVTLPALTQGQSAQLIVGRPDSGRTWVITRVTVLGADDHTALPNWYAAVYIGDPANVGLGQCVAPAAQVPFISTQNEHAWTVHDREDLFLNITAIGQDQAAGQVIVTTIQAYEYRDCDLESQVI